MTREKKDQQVRFNASEAFVREIDAAAQLADLSRSEFLRRAAKEKASATSPREIEKKKEALEAEAKRYEKEAEQKKNKAKQLQKQLEEFGDAHEQYNDAVCELADEIRDVDNAKDSATAKVLRDATNPRIRKIAEIAKVEPQQVVRDVMNELAVESLDDLPETRVATRERKFGKPKQEPEATGGSD